MFTYLVFGSNSGYFYVITSTKYMKGFFACKKCLVHASWNMSGGEPRGRFTSLTLKKSCVVTMMSQFVKEV